jgi:hypothetical protein
MRVTVRSIDRLVYLQERAGAPVVLIVQKRKDAS